MKSVTQITCHVQMVQFVDTTFCWLGSASDTDSVSVLVVRWASRPMRSGLAVRDLTGADADDRRDRGMRPAHVLLSVPSRSSAFMKAPGPPVEAGSRADEIGLLLERDAAGKLGIFELLDGSEMLVDQRRIRQRPEMLSWLQFRRIGRQEKQMHMVRHAQLQAGMPPCAVEHQHNLLVRTSADLARKRGQFHFKERDTDGGRQVEDGVP